MNSKSTLKLGKGSPVFYWWELSWLSHGGEQLAVLVGILNIHTLDLADQYLGGTICPGETCDQVHRAEQKDHSVFTDLERKKKSLGCWA